MHQSRLVVISHILGKKETLEPDEEATRKINQKPNALLVKKGKNIIFKLVCQVLAAAGLYPGAAHDPAAELGMAAAQRVGLPGSARPATTSHVLLQLNVCVPFPLKH